MTALTNITYENTGIRMLGTKLEPWFVAVDVLRVLGYHTKNITRTLEPLDDDEKMFVNLSTGERCSEREMVVISDYHPEDYTSEYETNPMAWIISEPGLYKIIFRSRTETAKAFTRWVTHEVLPQIRKTGKYIPPQPKRPRGRQKVAHELSDGRKLFLSDLRVHCALYEGVDVNKSLYKHASAEDCVKYINQKIADGARIDRGVDDCEPDETYFIVVDGKRIEIPV